MSIEIEILEEKKNPLIERTEYKFKIDHFQQGTPNRLDVKKKLAAMQGADDKMTIIKKLQTYFGTPHLIGTAYIYENVEDLNYYEAFHIKVRNLPKEKRSEIYKLKLKNQPYEHLFEYE